MYESNKIGENIILDVCDQRVYTSAEVLVKVINKEIEGYLWNKLILSKNINEKRVYFEKGRIVEDLFPVCEQISYANKISFINKPLYNYRQHMSSTLYKIDKVKGLEDYVYANKEVAKLIKCNKDIKENIYYEFITNIQFGSIIEYYKMNFKCTTEIYSQYTIDKISLYEIIFKIKASFKVKIKLILFYFRLIHVVLSLFNRKIGDEC